MGNPSDPNPDSAPDVGSILHHEASGDSPLLPDRDATARQRSEPRMETIRNALVERIAAVDAEQQRSSAQMHEAIESQRSDLALVAKRQRTWIGLIALLMILLTAFSIGFVHFQIGDAQQDLGARLERLQQRLPLLGAGAARALDTSKTSESSFPSSGAVDALTLSASSQDIDQQILLLRERLATLMVEVSEIKSKGAGSTPADATNTVAATPRPMAASGSSASSEPTPEPTPAPTPKTESARATTVAPSAAQPARVTSQPEWSLALGASQSLLSDVAVPEVDSPSTGAPELDVSEGALSTPRSADAVVSSEQEGGPPQASSDASRLLTAARPDPPAGEVGLIEALPAQSELMTAIAMTGGSEPAPEPAPAPAPASASGTELAVESVAAAEKASETDAALSADAMDSRSVDELVDALIERRLDEVDRDYQRLAGKLSAPAVRPRQSVEDELADADDELAAVAGEVAEVVQLGAAKSTAPAAAPSTPERITLAGRPFVLQLIGFYRRELLDEFVARSPLPRQVYLREETLRGRPWFVLIHSLYADRAAAREASKALPDELGALDLWIRELPPETELEVIETPVGQG